MSSTSFPVTISEWDEWLQKLQRCRGAAFRDDDKFLDFFRNSCKKSIQNQLLQYCAYADTSTDTMSDDTLDLGEEITQSSDVTTEQRNIDRKELILCTRKALRLALGFLSKNDDNDKLLGTIQIEAYDCWCTALLRVISSSRSNNSTEDRRGEITSRVDSKCQMLSTQVLCNLITQNPKTARQLTCKLPLAPSEDAIATKILFLEENKKPQQNDTTTIHALSWVDLLLSCTSANNRPALAAVVACLHNCLAALDDDNTESSSSSSSFAISVASSTLLVSTLLRQIVSARAFQLQQQKPVNNSDNNESNSNKVDSTTDSATEWITLVIDRLCRADALLSSMYESIGKTTGVTTLPEHIVLLHCVLRNVLDDRCNALGSNLENTVETHVFLVHLFLKDDEKKDNDDGMSDTTNSLISARQQLILDILAETLANDDNGWTATIRRALGTETMLLQRLVFQLGASLDAWLVTNNGRQARDHKAMSREEQRRTTSTLRVLGNLLYACRHNQDLLRTTLVPQGTVTTTTETIITTAHDDQCRNGLHVLLSSTVMSHSCFALRESAMSPFGCSARQCRQSRRHCQTGRAAGRAEHTTGRHGDSYQSQQFQWTSSSRAFVGGG